MTRGILAWLGTGSAEVRLIVFTVVAVALAWLGLLAWDWRRKRAALTSLDPRGLFESLCEAHRLSDGERDVLRRIAGPQFPQPAIVFVDPRPLREAVLRGHSPAACEALLRRLFGDAAGV